MHLPNFLTYLRIILIPIFVFFYYISSIWAYRITTGIFIFACLTDWLDGYLARKLKQESLFGAFLDPVADKLIVVVTLVLLVESYSTILLSIPSCIIICREILISALREVMAAYGNSSKVSVVFLGKVKTFLQMISIAILLSQPPNLNLDNCFVIMGFVLLYISIFITMWSMIIYLYASWNVLNNNKDNST